MISCKWGGYHDQVDIALLGFGLCLEGSLADHPAAELFKSRLHDVDLPLVDGFYYVWIDVHTGHVNAVVGCHDGGGKANIAKSHETCFHIFLAFSCQRSAVSFL